MVPCKFANVFVIAMFVVMCAYVVHPSSVADGHTLTKRSNTDDVQISSIIGGHTLNKRSDTDHAAAGAATAGDVIAATGGIISAGALATGPFAPVVAGVGGVIAATGGLVSVISRAADQSCREFGCHKNYCWSYCSLGNQWCYTTKTYSQSYNYVSCTKDEDCNGCWKCGGPCTL
ncbi:Hypothetical protein CINCED_3A016102 [Cinara cedri]|uniref:Uncharacterized protein n=1 Tax=Cinara cedri TaxID=506608 RepID=A0A5E4MIR5_9HEMI|nr:Hypothetical protein CINCED_3A016102 [Cinara cedri]